MGTYFNTYSVVLDLAYLKTTPLPGLTLIGGRIPNPFFFSDLVWWHDLTFEGFAGTYRHSLSNLFEGFATAGAFPLWKAQYRNQSDKWLYAGQVGLDIKPRKELLGRIGVAYYDFQHTRGIANNPSLPGSERLYRPPIPAKREHPFRYRQLLHLPCLHGAGPRLPIPGAERHRVCSTWGSGTRSTWYSWGTM